MEEPYVPIGQVAKLFNVQTTTIAKWVRQNHIPQGTYVKMGNTYRFKIKKLERMLMEKTLEETETDIQDDQLLEIEDVPELEVDDVPEQLVIDFDDEEETY